MIHPTLIRWQGKLVGVIYHTERLVGMNKFTTYRLTSTSARDTPGMSEDSVLKGRTLAAVPRAYEEYI